MVQMRPDELLATRRALDAIAHTYSDAYLADHPTADPWVVFFAVLHGLQDGVGQALETLTPVVQLALSDTVPPLQAAARQARQRGRICHRVFAQDTADATLPEHKIEEATRQ